MNEGVAYFSYLLRLWQVPSNGGFAWRVLLENIQTGEKRGFASLEDMMAYLSNITGYEDSKSGEGSRSEVQG